MATIAQSIQLNQRQMAEVYAMFAGIENGAERAITRALNKTATSVRSAVVKETASVVNLTQKVIREHTEIVRADFTSLSARIIVTGRPVPLIDYKARWSRSRGVTVRVRTDQASERFPDSFITAVPNKRGARASATFADLGDQARVDAHKGVFRRVYRDGRRVPRLPIKERFGPSVPMVFHYNKEAKVVVDGAGILAKNLDHEASYLLSQVA